MSVNDPPPSYEVATGLTTTEIQPTSITTVIGNIPEQQQSIDERNNVRRCFQLVNTPNNIKSIRYSRVCLAVLVFFCFCGTLAIIVYFVADD